MDRHTVPRTGDIPLEFTGRIVSRASTKEPVGEGRFRWHELTLFDLGEERYAVHVWYRSDFLRKNGVHEAPYHWGQVVDGIEALRDWLHGLNESRPVVGYPPGDHFAAKQKRLLLGLRLRYEQAISNLLSPLGTEVVRVHSKKARGNHEL